MQRKFNHTFTKSKMNKDLDARLLAPDEYRDGQNIAVSRAESDDVGALENILGNKILNSLNIPELVDGATASYDAFLSQIIGWYINENTNKVYVFTTNYQDNSSNQINNYNPLGTRNTIVMCDLIAETTLTIVQGGFLNFSSNSPILDSTMIENLLFWTDNRNQPRVINVETAENNPSYYFNEDHVSLAKYYPSKPIQLNNTFQGKAALVTTTWAYYVGSFNTMYPAFILTAAVGGELSKMLGTENTQGAGNIGLKGFLQIGDESWDFTVQYASREGFTGNDVLVVPNRDLSTASTPQSSKTANKNLDVVFIEENSKDVSSPWLREHQATLELTGIVSTGQGFQYASASSGSNYDYAPALYLHGTRSASTGTATGIGTEAFFRDNHFTKNTLAADKKCYCRVTHPKLDPGKYYVARDPGDTTAASQFFKIYELTSLQNGTYDGPKFISTQLNLVVGDRVKIHYPNKYYDANYSGDPDNLKDKFVRFAYRFKFDDGEYSLISPFTQEVFIPKQKGYFLKNIGKQDSTGSDQNAYIPQERVAGQNTIVAHMENEVTQIGLRIPCEYAINTLKENLKVSEIDILYKDSMSQNINVIKSIEATDPLIINNSTNNLTYTYDARKPIKTLRSAETTRVYDNVPIRAKTLSSAGNRVILGNYFDRHSAPNTLNYLVGASRKFTPTETAKVASSGDDFPSDLLPNKYSNVSYPNHSLKQNRNYQVGLILQDRYGRSSDVILSSTLDANYTLGTGGTNTTFEDNPITFGGSTVYHPYNTTATSPNTSNATILSKPNPKSGYVDWPGDSLKILFTTTIPSSLPNLIGYPGLYKEAYLTTTIGTTAFDYITVTAGGLGDNIAPGMRVEFTETVSGATGNFVLFVYMFLGGGTNLVLLRGLDGAIVSANDMPISGSTVSFYVQDKPLGFNSYKVVVKQNQQDYYNVYLPSLLDGTPVIKPFDLNCVFTSGSKLVTVSPIGTIEYLTFPLLEGMKVVAGANTYYINNILNYTQFELTTNAVATATVDAVFSTNSSDGVLNVTTLLTDNANKVPPALNETTPVQVQYSTSDVELIPRAARNPDRFPSGTGLIYQTLTEAMSVFPGISPITSKVTAIGNFEALYKRGSYNGLYKADTDPPTAVIENHFNLGESSQTAKPPSEAEFVPAVYETTPTISEIDIYYETSTAGLISDLNDLVLNTLSIPNNFLFFGTDDIVKLVEVQENVDYTTTPTIATINLINQNADILAYNGASDVYNLTGITTPLYRDGTPVAGSGITLELFSTTDSSQRLLLKLNSNFPGYNSGNDDLNYITFNAIINHTLSNSSGALFGTQQITSNYEIPITIYIDNIAPAKNTDFINDGSTVYYLNNSFAFDPSPTNVSGASIPWANNNSTSTTLSSATNGSNVNNTAQNSNTEEIQWTLEVDLNDGQGYQLASKIESIGLFLRDSGTDGGSVVLATSGGSIYNYENIDVNIYATDNGGRGIKTLISNFIVRFKI
jgi:hypothetical protein